MHAYFATKRITKLIYFITVCTGCIVYLTGYYRICSLASYTGCMAQLGLDYIIQYIVAAVLLYKGLHLLQYSRVAVIRYFTSTAVVLNNLHAVLAEQHPFL